MEKEVKNEGVDNADSSGMVPDVKDTPSEWGNVTGNVKIVRELYCPVGSTAVSYTDDLRIIAVGQENGSVQLFEDGRPTFLLYDIEMMQEMEPCTDIKIKASPKNGYHKSILVTYLGGHIKLWDTKGGRCLFTMKEKRHIYGVTYHPKNSKFVTVGNDFKVYLYDEERRVTERILACSEIFGSKNGHTDSVCCAKFHPKNPFEIISSGLDNTIQFWDLRAPYAVRHIANVVNFGEALDISNDGRIILAGVSSSRNCTLRIYDYETGVKLRETPFYNAYVYCCKFLSSAYVGLGGFFEHTFRIVDMKSGQVYGSVDQLPGCVMSFAAKRKILQQTVQGSSIPGVLVSSGKKVLEIEAVPKESDEFEKTVDFYYET